jgi:hypothetical protein
MNLGIILVSAAMFALSGAAHADLSISSKPTQNMSCEAGVCTATAPKAVLNVGDLQAMLASGDVSVMPGQLARDIDIVAPVSWASSRLTLDAYRSIMFAQPVTAKKRGGVTIATKTGDYFFTGGGKVTFLRGTGALVVNGETYKLENTLTNLAIDISANPAGFFALSVDYDASNDGTYGFSPIATPLQGNFAGMGHAISNLSIVDETASNLGLFAENDGIMRNIALVNVNVSGKGKFANIGAMVGNNTGRIFAASVSGVVRGTGKLPAIGGVVGINWGLVSDSVADVTLKGGNQSFVGGLVGESWGPGVVNSSAHGHVAGGLVAAGLVGWNFSGPVRQSYSDATVVSDFQAGGLVGLNDGVIDQSFSTGRVKGSSSIHSSVGGLVGENGTDTAPPGKITNAYARGDASGGPTAGLVGVNRGSIDSAYSTGSVFGSPEGGFIGSELADDVSASYWDLNTSGIGDGSQGCGDVSNCVGVTGLTTTQLTSGLPPGFDPDVWGESADVNEGYPYLLTLPPGGGAAARQWAPLAADMKVVPRRGTEDMERRRMRALLSKEAQYRAASGPRVP